MDVGPFPLQSSRQISFTARGFRSLQVQIRGDEKHGFGRRTSKVTVDAREGTANSNISQPSALLSRLLFFSSTLFAGYAFLIISHFIRTCNRRGRASDAVATGSREHRYIVAASRRSTLMTKYLRSRRVGYRSSELSGSDLDGHEPLPTPSWASQSFSLHRHSSESISFKNLKVPQARTGPEPRNKEVRCTGRDLDLDHSAPAPGDWIHLRQN